MDPHVLDIPPAPDQRIDAVHAWIATYADGSEGIVSADLPMPGGLGLRHMPLLNSKLEVAARLEALAYEIKRQANRQGHAIMSVELVSFARTAPRGAGD